MLGVFLVVVENQLVRISQGVLLLNILLLSGGIANGSIGVFEVWLSTKLLSLLLISKEITHDSAK